MGLFLASKKRPSLPGAVIFHHIKFIARTKWKGLSNVKTINSLLEALITDLKSK